MGRLIKWSIKLSEFHIEYKPRMVIKAQALADFVVEFTHEAVLEPEVVSSKVETPKPRKLDDHLSKWMLFVDGSSNKHGYGSFSKPHQASRWNTPYKLDSKPPTMKPSMKLFSPG